MSVRSQRHDARMDERTPILDLQSENRWVIAIPLLLAGAGVAFVAVGGGSGIGLIGMGVFLAYVQVPEWRPVRLTHGGLIVPAHARDQYIPIDSIAGVGVSLVRTRRGGQWRTTIWSTDGLALNVRSWTASRHAIADSVGAQRTRALWEAVIQAQGPDGPLATLTLQHRALSSWADQVWCPDDGRIYQPTEVA
jgi:hypothetical protein